MAINYPLSNILGTFKMKNFPKEQYNKIKEIIDVTNGLTTSVDTLEGLITVGTVTQQTAITTAVTVNAMSGVITTVSSVLAAGSNATFTVNNSYCTTNSVVLLTHDDSASAGIAHLNVQSIGDGAFDVNITNIHAANAFNNVIKVYFTIINPLT